MILRYLNEDGGQELKTTYSIDHNQVFHANVRHVLSGTQLLSEKMSMKDGRLGIGDVEDETIDDDFTIE